MGDAHKGGLPVPTSSSGGGCHGERRCWGKPVGGRVAGSNSPLMGTPPNVTFGQGFGIGRAWFKSQLCCLPVPRLGTGHYASQASPLPDWGGSLSLYRVYPRVVNAAAVRSPGDASETAKAISNGQNPLCGRGQGMCTLTRCESRLLAPSGSF